MKKIISVILSASMLSSAAVCVFAAEDSGEERAAEIVGIVDGTDAAETEESAAPEETEEPENAAEDETISVAETNNADGVIYKPYEANQIINTNVKANEDYVFYVNGKSFSLLDRTDNGNCLVIANNKYGNRTVKADSFTNAEDESSLNYWLNNSFLTSGGFDTTLSRYINYEHIWQLDPAPNAQPPIGEGVTFTAGITIPSVSEMEYYGSIIGYDEPGDNYSTRTVLNSDIAVFQKTKSEIDDTSWKLFNRKNPSTGIRPMFEMRKSFFAENPIDLTTAGERVKDVIREIDVNTLAGIYEIGYLTENLGVAPPEGYLSVSNIGIEVLSGEDVKNGETLKANFTYDSANEYEMAGAEFVWERMYNGESEEVGTGDTYIVNESDTIDGKYSLRFKVTVTDTAGHSTTHKSPETTVVPAIAVRSYAPNYAISMRKDWNNDDYKFTVGDKKYVLLDTFNNDKSTFFVVPDFSTGKAAINSAYFDPKDSTNIAYAVNTTLIKSGLEEGEMLPDEIVEHIDFDHMWVCESAPTCPNENVHSSYAYKAGLSLLSYTEVEKYKNAVATINDLEGYSRTAADYIYEKAPEINYINTIRWNDEGTNIWANHWDTQGAKHQVRAAFYLDKSFFTSVGIDWSGVGAKAREMLSGIYTVEDFGGRYSDEVLEECGFKHNYEIAADVTGLNGGVVSTSGTVMSNIRNPQDGVIIICVYDEKGAAVASKAAEINFDETGAAQFSLSTAALTDGAYSAKIMFWNSFADGYAETRVQIIQ